MHSNEFFADAKMVQQAGTMPRIFRRNRIYAF
jgi:hypothetical protein